MLAPEECRPAAAAAATLSWGFIRTGAADQAFGLQLSEERGGGGCLLRYYRPLIENIMVPLKGLVFGCLDCLADSKQGNSMKP